MSKIKLKTRQLAVLQQIVNERVQLNKVIEGLNQKEGMVLELIFEENSITGTVTSVKLEGDNLSYELNPVKESK